ncbi:hypothetical protein ZYGR_0AG05670 [Zygosaccharomyces rouxii]|uniref:Uncharacterized protein n=1 Tax=Zygosaccharomyces rouxii TaxID=4956 RepID=A0A1Q3AA08_ZYGRO|nr:hypothetical protein ZYGR_0AG05670 [Zygosaccharomyces rouxii]
MTSQALERPLVHLTPLRGWLNDPNGLWYDAKDELWHCYFQHNPDSTVWKQPICWGHSVSKNAVTWDYKGLAIVPSNDDGGVFSGSVVVDSQNTSKLFDETTDSRQRVVAIWTQDTEGIQRQMISYSVDGGYSFKEYSHNPVLDINNSNFRDPKVIWHKETRRWIMVVALSQKFEISIHSSEDLIHWQYESGFTVRGFKGLQYECPGLVKVPLLDTNGQEINDSKENWVLYISINPGAPQGGSATEYFIGEFDGKVFKPTDNQVRFMDLGKDFYAFQTFFNTPNYKDVIGMAWASNWQYTNQTPTTQYRSCLTILRKLHLQKLQITPEYSEINLFSAPLWHQGSLVNLAPPKSVTPNLPLSSHGLNINLDQSEGLLEFTWEWSVEDTLASKADFCGITMHLKDQESSDHFLSLGFEANSNAFFLDRGNTGSHFVQTNPLFTRNLSVDLTPYKASQGTSVYKVHGILDRNILELYFNEGALAATYTFFYLDNRPIGWVHVNSSVNGIFKIKELRFAQLAIKQPSGAN